MEHSDDVAKSVLVLFIAVTLLLLFPENLEHTSFAKDYPLVFHTLRNSSRYHVNTSFSPSKLDVDFKLHNTTGTISLVGNIILGHY